MSDPEPLQIGLNLPTWPLRDGGSAAWPELRRLARAVEAAGVDTLWVPDHQQRSVPGRPTFGFWECWTILTAAAEATSRIGVGPFIANTSFRNPALLAKMAATLDEVSGGRLVLALGSGDPTGDESWRAFGVERDRPVARHAEAVEIIVRMLREPPVTFEGTHYSTVAADILPARPRAGRPPVWVAAKGDHTLAIAVRWADAVNVNMPIANAEDARAIVARVAAACAEVGRDPATLGVTGWARLSIGADGTAQPRPGWIAGSLAEAAATMLAIHAAGIRHLTLYPGEAGDRSPLPALTAATLDRFRPFLEALRAG